MPEWKSVKAKLDGMAELLLAGTIMLPMAGGMMAIGGGYPIDVFGFEVIAPAQEKNETLSQIGHVIHGLVGKVLIAAILVHILGAIKHHFMDKDGTVSRMLGRRV